MGRNLKRVKRRDTKKKSIKDKKRKIIKTSKKKMEKKKKTQKRKKSRIFVGGAIPFSELGGVLDRANSGVMDVLGTFSDQIARGGSIDPNPTTQFINETPSTTHIGSNLSV
jgi:hypothetical protein